MHAPCNTIKDSMLQNVEAAINNLGKAVGEAYVCEPTSYLEERAFLDVILTRLSRTLEENISEIRSRRNCSAPINRLPSEILNHVFSLSHSTSISAFGFYSCLLSLSLVCQRWREIILADATLWTTIDFVGSTEFSKTILRRSKEAKLLIEIKDQLFSYPDKLGLLKSTLRSQAYRIEKIAVTLWSSNIKAIEDALLQPLPSLRHLCLRGDYFRELPNLNYRIPFTADTSSLEVLDIFGCSRIPWSCLHSIICKVRKLRIRFDDEETYLNFFADIQAFDKLKVLSLHCCFVDHLPQLSPMTLSGLTTLLIDSKVLISLVDSIRAPNLKRFTVFDELDRTFRSEFDFDYSSIHYLSVGVSYTSGCFRFYIVGSTERDTPGDNLWNQEFHLPDSSLVRRFQLRMHFNYALGGYTNVLKILNAALSRAVNVREVCLPSRLHDWRCPNTPGDCAEVPFGAIMKYTPLVNCFTLSSTTSDSYLFQR